MSGRHVASCGPTSARNPILTHLRDLMPRYRRMGDAQWFVESVLGSVKDAQAAPTKTLLWAHAIANPDQIEQARRVLTKLAALK